MRSVSCINTEGTVTRTLQCLRSDGVSMAWSYCGSQPATSMSCSASCSGTAPAASQSCTAGTDPCRLVLTSSYFSNTICGTYPNSHPTDPHGAHCTSGSTACYSWGGVGTCAAPYTQQVTNTYSCAFCPSGNWTDVSISCPTVGSCLTVACQ